MSYKPVHEMELDRATSRLEITNYNPTRQFQQVLLDEQGHWRSTPALYTWQGGKWYDTGGNEMRPETVPQMFRDEIEANPVLANTVAGPKVTWTCKVCNQTMNQSDSEAHLLGHVAGTVAAAGALKTDPQPPKTDANRHTRG